VVLGLDTRFLGRKWQKKNDDKNKTNKISQLPVGFFVAEQCPAARPFLWFRKGDLVFGLVNRKAFDQRGRWKAIDGAFSPRWPGREPYPRALPWYETRRWCAVLAVETKSPAGAGLIAGTEAD
jgi:hypothetical protein